VVYLRSPPLLGCYAATVGSCFPLFQGSHQSYKDSLTLKMEPIGCPEMSVLLTMILVRNQIRKMFGRETGKIKFVIK